MWNAGVESPCKPIEDSSLSLFIKKILTLARFKSDSDKASNSIFAFTGAIEVEDYVKHHWLKCTKCEMWEILWISELVSSTNK